MKDTEHLSKSAAEHRLMDDVTIYGTPTPGTPYTTPASTPHRIAYRMNPVRLVRQHVPLKIQSSEMIHTPPVKKEKDAVNSSASMNPMKTKRTKCVIRSSVMMPVDGVGDQLDVMPVVICQQMSMKSTPPNTDAECLRQIAQPPQYLTSKSCEQRILRNSRGDAERTGPFTTNSCDDNRATRIPIPTNPSNNVESTSISMLEMMGSVALIKKEVDTVRSKNTDEMRDDKTAVANAKETQEKLKKDGKRSTFNKKSAISNSDSANPPVGHECDKKKFYDPQDIRKYMVKKKNERKAKEKEEKCKKASEQAAVKRKTDVTKLISIRPKFPSYRGQEQSENQCTATSDKSRASKKLKNSKANGKPVSNENIHVTKNKITDIATNYKSRRTTCDSAAGQPSSSTVPQSHHTFNTNDFNSIEKIRMCAGTNMVTAGARLYSPGEGLQILPSGSDDIFADRFKLKEKQTEEMPQLMSKLPSEVNVLKYKNPYNFLNILKVKMNLARKADNVLLKSDDNVVSTSVNQIVNGECCGSKNPFIDDLAKKRQRLENPHMEVDTRTSLLLKPELTLSDLNLSPVKKGGTSVLCGENEVGDKTFVVKDMDCDLKRKFSLKQYDKDELKENHNAFEISGVRPLASSKWTAPLSENKVITNTMESESSYSDQNYPILGSKSHQLNSDRLITDQLDKEERTLKRKSDIGATVKTLNTNLMKVSSLESLKVPNLSFMLSHPLSRSFDCATTRDTFLKTPLIENLDSTLIPTDCEKNQLLGDIDEPAINNLKAMDALDDFTNTSSTTLFADLYDQMMNNEEEKLSQILTKIKKHKESLSNLFRSEIYALETQKNQYREVKDEENVRALKKKQRAVLLRATKNFLELDKMSKSAIITVERRKAELLKQKHSIKEARSALRQTQSTPKAKSKKKLDTESRTYLISNQMKTVFGISSSSCTSVVLEDDALLNTERVVEDNVMLMNEDSNIQIHNVDSKLESRGSKKDSATSPVHFNAGISIRLDLNPEKILHLKNACAQVMIEPNPQGYSDGSVALEGSSYHKLDKPNLELETNSRGNVYSDNGETDTVRRNTTIKIKRPLSPMVFSPSKRALHVRRHSSSSDVTIPSLYDTTTTDQSDLELRISSLQEQLKQRKLEAERLRKEEKKLRKERLRSKEQSLMKQLEAYDQYIKRISKMLSEEGDSVSEISKPLIKPSVQRKHQSDAMHEKISASAIAKASHGLKYVTCEDDAGTNSEDSDKQLKKADSGILIESEVTDPSETAAEQRHSDVVEYASSSTRSVIRTEVSSPGKSVDSKPGAGNGSFKASETSNEFLQLVNDLQCEVLSLSEQLYSPDFVDDVADAKSENNTSMSIEEILSDCHSDANELVKNVEDVVNVVEDSMGTATNSENLNTVLESPEKESSEQDTMKTGFEGEEEDSSYRLTQQAKEVASIPPKSVIQRQEKEENLTSLATINSVESVSNSDAGLLNVKNISDIESTEPEEEQKQTLGNNSQIGVKLKLHHDVIEKAEEEEEEYSTLEEIKSVGSQEGCFSHDGEQTPKFAEISESFESKGSPDFLQLVNRFNESEDSNATDIVEPVRFVEDVSTFLSDMFPEVGTSVDVEKFTPVTKVEAKKQNFLTEYGADETDISESLEYDPGVTQSADFSESGTVEAEVSESQQSQTSEEVSREAYRSTEELLENHSMPNIFGATFIVDDANCNHDSPSLPLLVAPAQKSSSDEKPSAEHDLETSINEEALRREQENFVSGKRKSMDQVAVNLVDTLIKETYSDLVSTLDQKTIDGELDNSQTVDSRLDRDRLDAELKIQVKDSNVAKKFIDQFDNEWYDEDDPGQSRLREAEELRLQQMKIEQEIEALQAQQNIPPYTYLREIPNKPPPPYMPPFGQLIRIPSNESELHDVVRPIIEHICKQLEEGVSPEDITQTSEIVENKAGRDAIVYKQFLFDLTKEVACDVLEKTRKRKREYLPWEELTISEVSTKLKPQGEQLRKMIETKISELFNFRSRINKEKLIIQWSRKKKTDFVDDLLIQELQEEETEWTNYEEDELIIKNRITSNLLDELIEDTVVSLQDAFQIKEQSLKK